MNRVTLIGRLTADVELKQSRNGAPWTSFTLAVNRSKKVQGQPDADFIRCKAFGKTAENLCKYMGKGQMIAVAGSIATGSYTNQQGQKVYTTDINVSEVQFLESRKEASQSNGASYQSNGYGQQSYSYQPPQSGYDDHSDEYRDLPF